MGEMGDLRASLGGDDMFSSPVAPAHVPFQPYLSPDVQREVDGAMNGFAPIPTQMPAQPEQPFAAHTAQAYPSTEDDQPTRQANTRSKPKLSTWSGRIVALRINRTDRLNAPKPDHRSITAAVDIAHPPRLLRFWRLLVGIGLLVAAWGGVLLLVVIVFNLANMLPSRIYPTEAFALFLMSMVGAVWLAVVTLGCILVGAFSLALSLTRRGW
ncbi:MAG: hypothetical protein ABI068_13935 [Ktedonobacterales bacterium]